MVEVSVIVSGITAGSVLVGLALAVLQLRNIKKVREAEVILRAQQYFTGTLGDSFYPFLRLQFKGYQDFVERYAGKPEELAFFKILIFFEGIGVLVKRRLVPLKLVDDFMHGATIQTWKKTEEVIRGYRKEFNWKEFEEMFEYLYNQIKDHRKPTE